MADPAARTTIALETGGATVSLGDAPGATGTPAETRTSGVVYVAVDSDSDPVDQESTVIDERLDSLVTRLVAAGDAMVTLD